MSKFYFHIIDGGTVTPDDEGMELSGIRAAQAEALISAREVAMFGSSKERRMILVIDEHGAFVNSAPVLSH